MCDFCNGKIQPEDFCIKGASLYHLDEECGGSGIDINYCPICGVALVTLAALVAVPGKALTSPLTA